MAKLYRKKIGFIKLLGGKPFYSSLQTTVMQDRSDDGPWEGEGSSSNGE